MKKSELEALGLDAKTIKAVFALHGKDMQALQAKAVTKAPNEDTRAAIAAMLPMIHKHENLTELLRKVNSLYYIENRKERPQEPPKAADETQPPEAENAPESAEEEAGTNV